MLYISVTLFYRNLFDWKRLWFVQNDISKNNGLLKMSQMETLITDLIQEHTCSRSKNAIWCFLQATRICHFVWYYLKSIGYHFVNFWQLLTYFWWVLRIRHLSSHKCKDSWSKSLIFFEYYNTMCLLWKSNIWKHELTCKGCLRRLEELKNQYQRATIFLWMKNSGWVGSSKCL